MSSNSIHTFNTDRTEKKSQIRFSPYDSRNPRKQQFSKDFLTSSVKEKSFFQIVREYRKEKGLKAVPEYIPPTPEKDPKKK